MNFNPRYHISNKLLINIKDINRLIGELNGKRFPKPILYKIESESSDISTHASTSIEGNSLGLTDVKRVLKSSCKNLEKTEREVVNYNKALQYLNKRIKDKDININNKVILRTHKLVTDKLIFESGKYREDSIVIRNPLTMDIVYLPPDYKDVKILVNSLIGFIKDNSKDIDPLILAGIFHKQFVIIHPFMDGNGRTCRLLTNLILAKLGIDTFELFSFENYFNKDVNKYFNMVGVFGDYYDLNNSVDYTQWLEYFTECILKEIIRVKDILEDTRLTPEYIILKDQAKILEYIQMNGYITDREYGGITERSKASRVIDFNRLIDMELINRKGQGRNTYYVLR